MNKIQIRTTGAVVIDGQPYTPGTLKVYFEDPVIKIYDTMGRQNQIMNASYDQVTKVDTIGVGIPFDNFTELKNFVLDSFFPEAPVTGGVTSSAVTVATYAEMITLATGRNAISFLVSDDEDKGMTDTTYNYFPTPEPTLLWVASTKENL
jgi:hypothetical protein